MISNFWPKVKDIAGRIWYEEMAGCLLCGKKLGEAVCRDCRELYLKPDYGRCVSCGKLMEKDAARCRDCTDGKGPKRLCKVTAFGHYDGLWKEFIQNIKFQNQPYLLMDLGESLASWAVKQMPPPDGIVPVPLHANRLAQRGFNQAEVLGSILGGHLGIRLKDVLVRMKDTAPQTSMGRQDRLTNLHAAFALKPEANIKGETLWLVDDVITTGATIGECAAVLHAHGAKEIFAYCLGQDWKADNVKK
jgi:ComF family protein